MKNRQRGSSVHFSRTCIWSEYLEHKLTSRERENYIATITNEHSFSISNLKHQVLIYIFKCIYTHYGKTNEASYSRRKNVIGTPSSSTVQFELPDLMASCLEVCEEEIEEIKNSSSSRVRCIWELGRQGLLWPFGPF